MFTNLNYKLITLILVVLTSASSYGVQAQNAINSLNAVCADRTLTSTNFSWDKPANVDSFHIYDLDTGNLISKQITTEIGFENIKPGVEFELQIVPICKSGCPEMLPDSISCSSTPCPNINVRINPNEVENPNLFFQPGNKINYCFLNGDGVIDFDSTITGIPTQPGRWESNGVVNEKGIFDVLASGFGIFQVRYVIDENDHCQFRDLYTIIVENLPPLDFTFDEFICPNTPSLFKVPSYVDPRIVPEWIIEGNGNLETVGLDSFKITWDTPGDYLVGMHIDPTINECLSDTVWHTVNVIDNLSTSIECTPFNDKIEYTWTSNSCFEKYKVIVDGVEVAEQTEQTYTVEGLAEGQTITLEILPIGGSCLCNIVSASETCTTTVCDPFAVELDNETFLCDYPDGMLQLKAIPTAVSTQTGYTQVWTGPNVTAAGFVDMTSLPMGESIFSLRTTIGQCNHDTTISIINTISPKFEIEFGGPACGGTRGFLDIYPEDYQDDYEIYIDGSLVDLENRYSVDLSNHEVYITDSYGCSSDVKHFDLSDFEQVSASFDQRDDIIIQEEQEVDYNVILSNDNTLIDSIRWYYGDEMLCGGESCEMYYSIAPEDSGSLCAEIFFDATCTQMICASIRVNKKYDYYIPNIISLDAQSSENSSFTIFSEDENMLVNSFLIFDQWGNKVYEKETLEKSKNIAWSGEMNGQTVSNGVFAYTGELEFSNGRILKINGDLTVLGGATN